MRGDDRRRLLKEVPKRLIYIIQNTRPQVVLHVSLPLTFNRMSFFLQLLIEIVADNCLDIATDKSGCCVLQQCLPNAEGETLERMMAEIIANAVFLSEHPYGFVAFSPLLYFH